MKKPTMGRPPLPGEKRTKLVAFYLTETDRDSLKKSASEGGFKSMSALVTAVIEPLIHGGFSVRSAGRAVSLVQGLMESKGVKFGASPKQMGQAVLELFVPPPPLIPDDLRDLSAHIEDVREYLAELEKQNETT